MNDVLIYIVYDELAVILGNLVGKSKNLQFSAI